MAKNEACVGVHKKEAYGFKFKGGDITPISLFLRSKLPIQFTADLYSCIFLNVVMTLSSHLKHNAFLSELIFLHF